MDAALKKRGAIQVKVNKDDKSEIASQIKAEKEKRAGKKNRDKDSKFWAFSYYSIFLNILMGDRILLFSAKFVSRL